METLTDRAPYRVPVKRRLLLVDDDRQLQRDVQSHFETLGYEVATADDGRAALEAAKSAPPDLIMLDINLPAVGKERAMDGIEVLQRLRDSSAIPVLMLTSTNVSAVKVMALTMGADDYVPKPFDLQELGARVEAILRRIHDEVSPNRVLNFKRLRIDPGERRVWKDSNLVELTRIEFEMLYTLARRPDHVFTRDKLLELAWKEANCSIPKVVDVHVGHIRKKIEDDPAHPTLIVTVRGTGYRFEDVPA